MTQFARICNKRKITVKQLPTYQISHSGEKRKSGKPKNKVKSAAKEKRRKSAEKLTENMNNRFLLLLVASTIADCWLDEWPLGRLAEWPTKPAGTFMKLCHRVSTAKIQQKKYMKMGAKRKSNNNTKTIKKQEMKKCGS